MTPIVRAFLEIPDNFFKAELKAKISNFCNIVFGKPNISKVNCMGYFFSFSVFCEKITFEVGLFLQFLPFQCGRKN